MKKTESHRPTLLILLECAAGSHQRNLTSPVCIRCTVLEIQLFFLLYGEFTETQCYRVLKCMNQSMLPRQNRSIFLATSGGSQAHCLWTTDSVTGQKTLEDENFRGNKFCSKLVFDHENRNFCLAKIFPLYGMVLAPALQKNLDSIPLGYQERRTQKQLLWVRSWSWAVQEYFDQLDT